MTEVLAFDVETTGLDAFAGARVFSFSTTDYCGATEVWRTEDPGFREKLEWLFSPHAPVLVAHNAHFDLRMVGHLLRRPVWWTKKWHDTMIMAHILMNHHYSKSLEDLAWDLLKYPKIDKEVHLLARQAGGMHHVPKEVMKQYQSCDTTRTMLLYRLFNPKIRANKQLVDIYQNECDVVKVTMDMEGRGVVLDRYETVKLRRELKRTVKKCRSNLESSTWVGFNPRSVLDMRQLLYQNWKLPISQITKKGSPSVGKEVLREIRNSGGHRGVIASLVIEHNSALTGVAILKSYLESAGEDDVIHPRLTTLAAITGRQSSSNPNLQNVAKEGVLLNPFPIPARRCFRPRDRHVNIHLDFSGIEMRLLVEYSGEEELVRVIREGGDVHVPAAETFFGRRFETANEHDRATLRGAGKNANFACPYGAGADKVVATLGLPTDEGHAAYKRYCKRFPRLVTLSEGMSAAVQQLGFVRTRFGRCLRVPKNKAYVGTNYVIQGTAAEILKRSQVRIHALHYERWPEVHLILTIHDEVVIEFPRHLLAQLPTYLQEVREEMTRFPEFEVPLEVEASLVTQNWSRKRRLEIPCPS